MKILSFLKQTAPAVLVLVLVISVLNIGSYNPYNEFQTFIPNNAVAIEETNSFESDNKGGSDQTETQEEDGKSGFSNNDYSFSYKDSLVSGFGDEKGFENKSFDDNESSDKSKTGSSSSSSSSGSFNGTCKVTASADEIYVGSDIDISWVTTGFSKLTLNGIELDSNSGTKTFHNLQENTTYTLVAKTADGKSSCTSTVKVICLPPPVADLRCTDFGFDFLIEKFAWESGLYKSVEVGQSDYTINLTGDNKNAQWSSNIAVDGVLAMSADGKYKTLSGGLSGNVNKCDISGSCKYIETLQFCGNEVEPVPMCELNPTSKTIKSGESIDLNWTTKNAKKVTLTDFGEVDENGSVNTGALTSDKTYELEVTGQYGETLSCISEIKIEKTTPYCELTLTKSVDKENAKPGDELTYTINIKNTGTADCTGGGVKIVDELDPNISFVSETHSGNIDAGYGSYPPYQESTRKLFWNGHDLNPGEEGTITWKGKVNEAIACGTEVMVKNKARATARELNYFSKWSYSNTVETKVYESCPVPVPKCDMFSVTPDIITRGDSAELVWKTTNSNRVTINNGIGEVNATGTMSVTPLDTTNYLLTVFGENDQRDTCNVTLTVEEPPVEEVSKCVAFSANPFSLPFGGGESKLVWTTENASLVTINNGIGEVNATGTLNINVSTTTTYVLIASDYVKEHSCQVTIDVADPIPAPTCTLTPSAVTIVHGGVVDLNWTTSNASSTSLTDFGNVDFNGATSTGVLTTDTTYVLEVLGTNGQTISCTSEITVEDEPEPISCSANVNLSLSPNSIDKGDSSALTWSTTDITSISFDQGINATGLSGSVSVSPSSDTTYTMTATDGVDTIQCPITLDVSSGGGGGGGGSSSPRCELEVSDSKIEKGEEVTLTWESSRATELRLVDSEGNVLVDTDNFLSKDKEKYFDGEIEVSPRVDTVYELIVERGSRDRTCRVKVEVENDNGGDSVVITEIRDQQPLISGIALTDVPYTGFEAGPILTSIFYTLLALWSAYIAYLLVIRRDFMGGYKLADGPVKYSNDVVETVPGNITKEIDNDFENEDVPKNIFSTPVNLPTSAPVIGYEALATNEVKQEEVDLSLNTDEVITEIENHAHLQSVLLSSDAIRYFVTALDGGKNHLEHLDEVIKEAKSKYPTEDGWIVLNEKRMRELCEVCSQNLTTEQDKVKTVPTVLPEGSGSLAEAIVTGNVIAAYQMIGHRPMFTLADAAADLDSVVRLRKGGNEVVSEMLVKETEKLSDEQLLEMVKALTGALDGTYTDEASAVKMAIMKAVKVAS